MKIGNYIKEKRLQKGMTQEELAMKCDITTRTIQRIESGEVDPRSYTLQAIAAALEVDYDELLSGEGSFKTEALSSKEGYWLALLHLSGLLVLIIPTVIVWIKNDRITDIRSHAIVSINFQISMMIYLIFTAFLCVIPIPIAITPTVRIPIFMIVGILLITTLGIYLTIIVIINTSKAANGQLGRYPLSIKFIKNK
jgi:transcriptional regulator with XRE-family HTH domain